MPKVPSYTDSVVPLRPIPDARQDSIVGPGFLAANAARSEQALDGVTRAGGAVARVAAHLQEERNLNKIFEASTALDNEMVEHDQWLREYKGQTAWGVTAKSAKRWEEYSRKAMEGLENDAQRQVFQQKLEKARVSAREKSIQWEENQREVSTKAVALAGIASAQDRAGAAVGTVSEKLEIENAKSTIRQNLDVMQEFYGISPEERGIKSKTEYTRLHLNVIQRKINAGDAEGARTYFENNKVEILGDVYDDVETKLKGTEAQVKGRDAVDAALALTDGNVDLATDEVRNAKLPPEVEKVAIARLKEIDADNDERKRENQKTANDAAWQAFFDGGSKMTAVSAALLHNADPATRLAMQHEADRIVAKKKDGGEKAVRTDPSTYYMLRQMMASDPAAFKSLDLRKLIPKLSPSDFEEFVRLQTNDEKVKDLVTIDKQLSIAHGLMGLGSKDGEEKATFDTATIEQLDIAAKEKGKPLTMEERQKVIDRMMMPGAIPGFLFDKSRRYYQVQGTPDEGRFRFEYRDSDLERARQALAKRGVLAPTRQQLEEVVRRAYGF